MTQFFSYFLMASLAGNVDDGYVLPSGWESEVSRTTGLPFYVFLATGETTYDRP